MATLPLIDLTGLRDPSPAAAEHAAAKVDAVLRGFGAFLAIGHGIPSRIPDAGFEQARLLFGLPASTRAALRAERGGRGLHTTTDDEGTVDRFVLGPDLPSAHALVAAGTPGYGPNRWPPLHGFRDAMTAWQRALVDVCELLYAAVATAHGQAPDHLVARHRCPLVQLCLDHRSGHAAGHQHRWTASIGGFELAMVGRPATSVVRSRDGEVLQSPVEPASVLVTAGALLEELTGGRYRAPQHRWELGDAGAVIMTLRHDLDHDAPLDCLRDRSGAEPGEPGEVGPGPTVSAFLARTASPDTLAS
ncbi:MAG: 2-oxoglutarate and iron-dependent oxygenase domain-containing protein [Acidimicrobiia bacterium]